MDKTLLAKHVLNMAQNPDLSPPQELLDYASRQGWHLAVRHYNYANHWHGRRLTKIADVRFMGEIHLLILQEALPDLLSCYATNVA